MKTDESETLEDSMFRRIAESSIYGNLVLFVGAGLPMAIFNSDGGKVALSWGALLSKCAKEYGISFRKLQTPGTSYPEIAEKLIKLIAQKKKVTISEATVRLKQTISDLTSLYPDKAAREQYREYFDALKPNLIITTNYDTVVESILTGKGHSLSPENDLTAPANLIPVYHLHGIRTNPDSIVITQEDYVKLFRPNEYRQQKLPLTIKESLVLLIGYSLGDFNVMTALDWSRNVFSKKKAGYPNGVIQFVYEKKPKEEPYYENDILIYEFNELGELLGELRDFVLSQRGIDDSMSMLLRRIEKRYLIPSNQLVKDFVNKQSTREAVYKKFDKYGNNFINGFMEVVSRGLDEIWKKAREKNGFPFYDKYLRILLEIIEHIDFKNAPPALIQMLSFGLERVGYYIGLDSGDAHAAYRTWLGRGINLNEETIKELRNISRDNTSYANLAKMLRILDARIQKRMNAK